MLLIVTVQIDDSITYTFVYKDVFLISASVMYHSAKINDVLRVTYFSGKPKLYLGRLTYSNQFVDKFEKNIDEILKEKYVAFE